MRERGGDGILRAVHNLCRHRGSRVVAGERGHCKAALICPYHGWAYNLDGTLRGAAQPKSFPPLDPVEWGLKPIEMEVWHGFVFTRFKPSDQPPVAALLARFHAGVASYPVAPVVASILLAREFSAPVLATVLATALGIAIVWLMFWMRPYWVFYSVLAFLPVATLAISVVLARRFEAPLFATATVALTALGLLMGLLIF